MSWFLTLPEPGETSGTPRKPFQKQEGVYYLQREPMDTEVTLWEPSRDTYILEFFELVTFLQGVLQLKEEFRNRVLDYLWNFFRVAVHPDKERCVILRTVDPEGWEDEVSLLFKREYDHAGT